MFLSNKDVDTHILETCLHFNDYKHSPTYLQLLRRSNIFLKLRKETSLNPQHFQKTNKRTCQNIGKQTVGCKTWGLFGSAVAVAFQSAFRAEIHQNDLKHTKKIHLKKKFQILANRRCSRLVIDVPACG